jgi:pSer/pThr/pTyr-binding forkhead associated (FHA) protein
MLAQMGAEKFEQSFGCGLLGIGTVEEPAKRVGESTGAIPVLSGREDPANEFTETFLGRHQGEIPGVTKTGIDARVWLIPYSTKPLLLGRKSTCDVIVRQDWISHRHLLVHFRDASTTVLQDAGALNGSWVRGRRLRAGEITEIDDGDPLRLGRSLFQFFSRRSLMELAIHGGVT